MNLLKTITIATVAFFFLVTAVIVAYVWWVSRPPRPPKGVPANAVFLDAPYVGFPVPPRGWWLVCRQEPDGRDVCKLSKKDGSAEYEGEFISYLHKGSLPASQLTIDPVKTREHKIWIGNALVPLVYLKNGEILIPANEYQKGVESLEAKQNP